MLDPARSYLCHNSSIHHRYFFCELVSFLIALRDEPFEERHLLHSLLCTVRFDIEICPILPKSTSRRPQTIRDHLLSACTIVRPIAFPEIVRCTSGSAPNVPYIPCIGPTSPSCSSYTTDHPHALHLPDAPNRKPSVATWFRKPSTGMLQLLCFSDSRLRTVRWLFFH